MRMRVCYLDCHEAGLCCYLVIHIENLLRQLQLFCFYLWLTLPRITLIRPRQLPSRSISNSSSTIQKYTVSKTLLRLRSRYSDGLRGQGILIRFSAKAWDNSPPHGPDKSWWPHNLLSNGYRGLYLRGKMTCIWSLLPPPSSAKVKNMWS
jgi:hypothetical protein